MAFLSSFDYRVRVHSAQHTIFFSMAYSLLVWGTNLCEWFSVLERALGLHVLSLLCAAPLRSK